MAELVVLLRGGGSAADARRTIESLHGSTPDLGICDLDSSADQAETDRALARSANRRVCVVGAQSPSGVVTDRQVWTILRSAPGADIAVLEVGRVVRPGWVELLRRAAYADGVIGTASAVPREMLRLRGGQRQHDAAAGTFVGVALGEPLWGCVYVRREALEIAASARSFTGDPAGQTTPRPLEEVVLLPGLVHVMAPTVVERDRDKPSPGEAPPLVTPAVRRALSEFEAAMEPLRVTIDLRCCAYPLSGTQVHALNLVSALAARKDLWLSVLTPTRTDRSVRPHLDALPNTVTRHSEGRPIEPLPHVFHRPFQLFEGQISDVVRSDVRLVVTHQDLILDRTPAYFPSRGRWSGYSAATALSFVAADEVVFFSEHAREEAVRDGYVDRSKTSVVAPGTDHLRGDEDAVGIPARLAQLFDGGQRPFLLFVGNSYVHKNRLFAFRVAQEMRCHHGWDGVVVCAGGTPRDGASASEERAFLGQRARAGDAYIDLGRVTDSELLWLYGHASLVLFPTLYEGFGLVPFEAAAAGTPCVYAARSSVGEYLPREGALLDLSDAGATASRLAGVLEDDCIGNAIVSAIRRAGESLTWSRAAESYAAIYRRAMTRPIGISLVLGLEIGVGARSELASGEAERRLLVLLRRSAFIRAMAERALSTAIAVRRALPRR